MYIHICVFIYIYTFTTDERRWSAISSVRTHDIGWLRLVVSLKLQVSFAEYRLFYRALLQK